MILIVEDIVSMRRVVAAMLRRIGFKEMHETANGQEALDFLRMRHVDVVLTDWDMPEMDGGELITQIRSTPAYASIPVMVFTSHTSISVQVTEAGADGMLLKPFSVEQLKQSIAKASASRAQKETERIILGADGLRAQDTHPLIIVGEKEVTARRLIRNEEKDTRHLLSSLVSAVESINAQADDGPVLGFDLEADGTHVARRVRGLPHRARLALLSTNLPTAVTTARLLCINRPSGLTVALACRDTSEIDGKSRNSLTNMGALFLERHRLDADAILELLKEQGIYDAQAEASRLPTPEELQQRLEDDVKATADLPVMAHVFQKISALDEDPDSAMQDWVDVISTDPLSSAQVIRRARSPAYGFRGEINEVDQAVILLGKDEVKKIVVSGAVKRALEQVTEKGFSVDEYWTHSVAVATTARLLSFPLDEAKWSPDDKKRYESFGLEESERKALDDTGLWSRFELKDSDDPYVGGIMHDIGKVVLAHAYPGLFPAVLEELEARKWEVPSSTVETELTGGSDHAVVGSVLASEWDLGESTTAAVLQHHSHHPNNALARLIAVSDFLASSLYPFPAQAKFPHVETMSKMLQEAKEASGTEVVVPEGLSVFVSDAITDDLKTSRSELLQLGVHIASAIRRQVEEVRSSVQ